MVVGLRPLDNDLEGAEAEPLVAGEALQGATAFLGLIFVDEVSFITLSWQGVLEETIALFLLESTLHKKMPVWLSFDEYKLFVIKDDKWGNEVSTDPLGLTDFRCTIGDFALSFSDFCALSGLEFS